MSLQDQERLVMYATRYYGTVPRHVVLRAAKANRWFQIILELFEVLQEFQVIFGKEIDRYLAKLATRGKTSAGRSFARACCNML